MKLFVESIAITFDKSIVLCLLSICLYSLVYESAHAQQNQTSLTSTALVRPRAVGAQSNQEQIPTHTLSLSVLSKKLGLPNNSIRSMMQDHLGYIWIGTDNGLVQYDGIRLKVFKKSIIDSLAFHATIISAICEDSAGNIWVGSQTEGLAKYSRKNGTWEQFSRQDDIALKEMYITALACDKDGTVWIGTPTGLVTYHPKSSTFSEVLITTTYRSITKIEPYGNSVWFVVIGGQFCEYSLVTKKIRVARLPFATSLTLPSTLQFLPNGEIVFLRSYDVGEILRIDSLTLKMDVRNIVPDIAQSNDTLANFYPLYYERNNCVWFSINKSYKSSSAITSVQLALCDSSGKILMRSEALSELFGRIPVSIADRHSPVRFFGTGQGVLRVIPQKNIVTTFVAKIDKSTAKKTVSGLDNSYIRSVAYDKNGQLWIGTTLGLHTMKGNTIEQKKIRVDNPFLGFVNLPTIRVNFLYNDPVLGMIICTNMGLYQLNTKTYRSTPILVDTIVTKKTLNETTTTSLYPSKSWQMLRDIEGNLWVGTNGDGLYVWFKNSKKATVFKMNSSDSSSLSNNQVWSIFQDSKKRVWIGTGNGLSRWLPKTQTFKRYTSILNKRNSLCGTNIWNIVEDSNHAVWFASFGGGLSKYNESTDDFSNVDLLNGLPSVSMYAVVVDNNNTMWLSTSDGVLEYNINKDHFRVFQEDDGFQNDEYSFKCGLIDASGRILFGGYHGLSVFSPSAMRQYSSSSKLILSSIKVLGNEQYRDVVQGDSIFIRYDENNITVEMTAFNYEHTSSTKYSHRLSGIDKSWVLDEFQRVFSYSNLDPGTYILECRSSNADGIWDSKPVVITIIISPAWWATWWARLLMVLVAIGTIASTVYFTIRYKTRDAEQRQAVATSQIQALRAQMNPHFMFNALNSVQRLILDSDTEGALSALSRFARLVRMSLESTIKPYHTLKDEIDWLNLYLSLEKIRYGNKLSYEIKTDTDFDSDEVTIPTMLIQPFIENSVRHGIYHKQSNDGLIRIMFTSADVPTTLVCIISDNGVGREKARILTQELRLPTTSVGITSTTERIRLMNESRSNKEHISIVINDLYDANNNPAGTEVRLDFPGTIKEY